MRLWVRISGAGMAVAVVFALVWSAAWIWMGTRVHDEVRGLTELSDTVVAAGRAADESGAAIEELARLPLVGQRLDRPAQRVREAGRSAMASGRASRDSAQNLSVLLGASIAVIPLTPLLLIPAVRLSRR